MIDLIIICPSRDFDPLQVLSTIRRGVMAARPFWEAPDGHEYFGY